MTMSPGNLPNGNLPSIGQAIPAIKMMSPRMIKIFCMRLLLQ